jgi:hypothetical protein
VTPDSIGTKTQRLVQAAGTVAVGPEVAAAEVAVLGCRPVSMNLPDQPQRLRNRTWPVVAIIATQLCIPRNLLAEPTGNDTQSNPSAPPATGYTQPYVNPSLGDSKPFGRGLSVGMMLGVYVGINVVAYLAWWRGAPPDQFEWIKDGWFGESTYAGGADKLGHFYACHLETRAIAGILEEGGWPARTSTYAGAALTMGTFYVIEMRDGFSTGFSVNDMISNAVGTATGVLFREVPLIDKLFDTRVEYIPSPGYSKHFKKKGFNFSEDYTGMTYLLAWHLSSLPVIEQLPGPLRFMDLVLGYNARNYRPKVADPHVTKYQDTFIGISLNLQRVVDELWMGRHPRWGESASRTHRFTHFATEFLNVPYTSLALGTWRNEYQK